MPIYEYRCASCGFEKDYLQKVNDPLLTQCPECGKAHVRKTGNRRGVPAQRQRLVRDRLQGQRQEARRGEEAGRGDRESQVRRQAGQDQTRGAAQPTRTSREPRRKRTGIRKRERSPRLRSARSPSDVQSTQRRLVFRPASHAPPPAAHMPFKNPIRRYFITGLLVWVPIVITVWVLSVLVGTMDQTLVLLPHAFRPETLARLLYPRHRRAAYAARGFSDGRLHGEHHRPAVRALLGARDGAHPGGEFDLQRREAGERHAVLARPAKLFAKRCSCSGRARDVDDCVS